MKQEDYVAILADETKAIAGDITWLADVDHSPAREFRAELVSAEGFTMFIQGRYNPLAAKLSYSLVVRGEGRIYGLDLGADHCNPDRVRVGEEHKHYWQEGARDKWAYVPKDITEPWDRPVEVWRQFCLEVKLRHTGTMSEPVVQGGLAL